MRSAILWAATLPVLFLAGASAAIAQDSQARLNKQLQGDYAFTGEGSCLSSVSGFNANLTPAGPSFGEAFSVQGVRTFNGDGTGTIHDAVSVSTVIPAGTPQAVAASFEASFTYVVAANDTYTTALDGPLTGTFLSGPRAGQTFTVVGFTLSGRIAEDRKSATLASPTTEIETQTLSDSIVFRICSRSRVLLKIKDVD
jgi:hypothetical protein